MLLLVICALFMGAQGCYWSNHCPYSLYSSKTPYDAIRGDIRDYAVPQNCQAVSIWHLNRHGNRNPGNSVTTSMKVMAGLKEEIISAHRNGTSQLCAQDIDEFRRWTWNETLEVSQSFLTGTGYEELYDIAKRIRKKYPHLLQGLAEEYYFRPTSEQRTITSAMAYVHGLSEGTNLTLEVDNSRPRDDVIRPYQNCERYVQEVREGPALQEQLNAYFSTAEYVAVRNAVQQRLGITTQLSNEDIYSIYELCRFYRSWTEELRSPWCAAFSDEDLVVLEYRDDVRHYHRNGYGSWINGNLGGLTLKDLYENFEAVVAGSGRKVVSYFTHDTLLEMVFCAMGIFKDVTPIQGSTRNASRLWRTSQIAAFSTNIIAVLNSCEVSGNNSYSVQLFVNERPTELCPVEGCSWQEFVDIFHPFTASNLDFCSMDYTPEPQDNGVHDLKGLHWLLTIFLLVITCRL